MNALRAFALLATLSLTALPGALCAAKLSWDKTEARLEMKPEQEEIRATFTVTNESEEVLRIADIRSTCGCTGSILDRRIMKPGESVEIVGTFNKGKRRGKNHNKLRVYLDSRPDPVATLHMIVDIPTLVEVQPAVVFWSSNTSQGDRQVRIMLDERYVDSIDRISYDREVLKLREEEDPAGKASKILRIEPVDPSQPVRQAIEITARGPDGRTAQGKVMVFNQP